MDYSLLIPPSGMSHSVDLSGFHGDLEGLSRDDFNELWVLWMVGIDFIRWDGIFMEHQWNIHGIFRFLHNPWKTMGKYMVQSPCKWMFLWLDC